MKRAEAAVVAFRAAQELRPDIRSYQGGTCKGKYSLAWHASYVCHWLIFVSSKHFVKREICEVIAEANDR